MKRNKDVLKKCPKCGKETRKCTCICPKCGKETRKCKC